MLIVFCVAIPNEESAPLELCSALVVCEVWEICLILKRFWLCQCFWWVKDLWYKCEVLHLLIGVECCCLSLLLWNLYILPLVFHRGEVVSDGSGSLISNLWNTFFEWCIGFTYAFSFAIVGWAFPVVDYVSLWASGIRPFGCMIKDLMLLVPLKKTLTLYFARVHLYCSLRLLMYGIITLVPSVNFPVNWIWFLLGCCWVWNVERTVMGSGCLIGLCEGDPFLLPEIQV